MRIIKIKNNQDISDDYCGQTILAGEYYTIQSDIEREKFAYNNKLHNHMSSDPQKIIINDGINDLDYENGKRLLESTDIQKIQQKVDAQDVSLRPRGMAFITTKQTTTNHDLLFDATLRLKAGEIFSHNCIIGDLVNVKVIDKDGVGVTLGWYDQATFDLMGNYYEIELYAKNFPIVPDIWNIIEDLDLSDPIPQGLYLRIEYTSDNTATEDAKCVVKLQSYKT